MTEERSQTDTDGVADPLVSRTYRESAAERTPPALDQAVLRKARREGTSRYSRSMLWLRPMAWAATVGLCLAIVVELSDLPQLDPGAMSIPASPSDATGLKDDLEELVETEAPEEIRSDTASTDDRAKAEEAVHYEPEKLEQRVRKTIDEDGRVNLQSIPQLSKTAAEQAGNLQADNLHAAALAPARAAGPDTALAPARTEEAGPANQKQLADTDRFEVHDAPVLEETAAMARMQEGKNKASELDSVGSSLGLMTTAASTANSCDEEAQSTPETWLECIETLVDEDLDDLADLQRKQLQEAFPEFPLP